MSRWSASPAWIETDLVRYPDIPLLTTDEVAAPFAREPRVTGTGISNSELKEVTEENFAQLLDSPTLPDPGEVAAPVAAVKGGSMEGATAGAGTVNP